MEQRNLLTAIVLSMAILITFQVLFADRSPTPDAGLQTEERFAEPVARVDDALGVEGLNPDEEFGAVVGRDDALADSPRIVLDSPRMRGSLSLRGARIDDLWLRDYRQTLAEDSPQVLVLSPSGAANAYFGEFGWLAAQASEVQLPGPDTEWTANATTLTLDAPLSLRWDNGEGLRFEQHIAVDDGFMFTVTQRVANTGDAPVTLYPYGRVRRAGAPDTLGFFVLHEGPLGVFNGTLQELSYGDVRDSGQQTEHSTGGWVGITEKYWLVALIPDQQAAVDAGFRYHAPQDEYQVDILGGAVVVQPGDTAEVSNRLFAGAKEVETVDRYRTELGIERFDLTIDWGWFFFLTKPIFHALDYLYRWTGNFGIAIIVLTMFVRLLFYPLANRSFRSFGAMRRVQPEVQRLREAYKDDRERMTKEMMELYRRENVNPLSGCMPLVLQIPVFFALYKVLFVTIEMRHSPFFGWIQDLSAPDPTSLFNLFGLIPWDTPSFLTIGIWPLLMGLSMFVQQKLNPAPPDPIQQRIFMMLPVVFTVILAGFPAGLVVYWTVNNVLTLTQQWIIMRRAEAAPARNVKR